MSKLEANEESIGMGRKHIEFFNEFIRVGYLEDINRTVYAVGDSGSGVVVTILSQDTLTPKTLPNDAVFFPQRFLMGRGRSVDDFNWA
jgi:hypothetical protein